MASTAHLSATTNVFEGRNRNNSERYGAKVYICRNCHEDIHHHPNKWKWLKHNMQMILMQRHGWTEEDFIKIFKRSYTDDEH